MDPFSPALLISEEAQDLICHYVRGFLSRTAQRTFRAFCLVSRRWLASGRRALYREPLKVSIKLWSKAEALLLTLEGNPGLARHVRSLLGLGSQSLALQDALTNAAEMGPSGTFGVCERATAGWTWASRTLTACQTVKSASLTLSDPRHASLLAKVLPGTTKILILRTTAAYALTRLTFDTWAAAVAPKIALTQLKILNFDWRDEGESNTRPKLPFTVKVLVFDGCRLSGGQLLHFIPVQSSFLRTLHLRTRQSLSPSDAKLLVAVVGPHLESLTYKSMASEDKPAPYLDTYDSTTGLNLPIELLTPLPNLRRLQLHFTLGMSIPKLRALAAASPLLTSLNLRNSTWDFKPTPEQPRGWPYVDFWHAMPELEAALDFPFFPSLKRLRLGFLPTKDSKLPTLEQIAKSKGFEFWFERCIFSEESGIEFSSDFEEDNFDEEDFWDAPYWGEMTDSDSCGAISEAGGKEDA